MSQSVNSFWKVAVQNAGFIFAYASKMIKLLGYTFGTPLKWMTYFTHFQHHFDETHLDAVRGLI